MEQRKEQRKLNAASSADADQPPVKRQRTEEEDKEWVSRLGGRGQRNREWFDEERKRGQRVVIDLGFDDLMTEREVKSLVTQVGAAVSGAVRSVRMRTRDDRVWRSQAPGRSRDKRSTRERSGPCCVADAQSGKPRRSRTCMAATESRRGPSISISPGFPSAGPVCTPACTSVREGARARCGVRLCGCVRGVCAQMAVEATVMRAAFECATACMASTRLAKRKKRDLTCVK